jgi:catechol 2,3-dioxygenase-like lactoylglutathione lyase family enzyme
MIIRSHMFLQQGRLGRLIAGLGVSIAAAGCLLAVVTGIAVPAAGQEVQAPSERVQAVASIGLTVGNLDRAVEFYTKVLSFEVLSEQESTGLALEHLSGVFGARCRTATLRLGDERIELTQFLAPEGRPIPADSRSNDQWFQHIALAVSDMDKAYAHLRRHNVRHASSGPQTLPDWNPNAGGISAFYFKDPDGHVLEVIHFPRGKGNPRWHADADRLFMGIDHTAIVVRDTDQSIAFYSGVLGMKVAGASENHGTEQEHLNNVFGARLRITALRAASGPGVELLEYLAPADGRPTPVDLRMNDLTHWHTTLVAPNADVLAKLLRSSQVSWISPGFVTGDDLASGVAVAAQILDPDRHAIVIAQPRTAPTAASQAATR